MKSQYKLSLTKTIFAGTFITLMLCQPGCWAPFRSPGVPACQLPNEFRMPSRTAGPPLNFAQLTLQEPADYLLGPNDVLAVSIPELREGADPQTISAAIMSDGNVHLPMVGAIPVSNLNLVAAQQKINDAYRGGKVLREPNVTISLETKATVGVLVLGQVSQPGMHYLPRYQNDIGHAIAAAGGITVEADDVIEVHRKSFGSAASFLPPGHFNLPTEVNPAKPQTNLGSPSEIQQVDYQEFLMPPKSSAAHPSRSNSTVNNTKIQSDDPYAAISYSMSHVDASRDQSGGYPLNDARARSVAMPPQQNGPGMVGNSECGCQVPSDVLITRIPMRGFETQMLSEDQIALMPGDVVVIPDRKHEVFYVVGQLSTTNTVRFTVGDRERELGVGFILPRDREIDVVTAVAMAGYIDPIDSPTTVTVQRSQPNGIPLLILVDLIAARSDPQQTVLVQPGDIIYLNPDAPWWWRRTFDRVIPDLITIPLTNGLDRIR